MGTMLCTWLAVVRAPLAALLMPAAAALRCVVWLAVFVQIEAQQLVEAETAQARELERSIAAAEVRGH